MNSIKSSKLKWIFISILISMLFVKFFSNSYIKVEVFDKEFEKMMIDGDIEKVVYMRDTNVVNIYLKKGSVKKCIDYINDNRGYDVTKDNRTILGRFLGMFSNKKNFMLYMLVSSAHIFDQNFKIIEYSSRYNQKIGYEVSDGGISWIGLISRIVSSLFTLFFFYYILLSIGLIKGGKGGIGGAFGLSRSKAKIFDKNSKDRVTFADVAGLMEAKEECSEIVYLFKNNKKLSDIGGKAIRGLLFVGSPGNGKTLLAKAIAGECGATFFSMSGSDFNEMFYGVGSARIRSLFEEANEKSPSIIFIDEIDSLGKDRSRKISSNDDQENTLNTLLVEMDGFKPNLNVLVIGATNRLEVLDKALLRPGRFDRKIFIEKPVLKEREEILNLYIKKIKIKDDEIDIHRLAVQTVGFSSAEIAHTCNEAAILATRENKELVEWKHFQEAIDRVIGGLERKALKLSEQEKRIVSYHEAGHALVSWFLKYAHPLLKVTIISRGKALGYAMYEQKEQFLKTKEEMIDNICTLLGGRCSEELIFKTISTGASNDLERVYDIARDIVTIFGMNEKIGSISYGNAYLRNPYFQEKPYSEETARIIDEEIRKLVEKSYERVKRLLTEKKEKLVILADELYTREVIDCKLFEGLIGQREPYFDS